MLPHQAPFGPLRSAVAAVGFVILTRWAAVEAGTIMLPNGSFESPTTAFADPRIDAWSDAPKPVWFDESGGASWDQLTGGFANPAPDQPDHIANCHGSQAAFLFAVPQVAMFQDYTSTDWANSTPTHAFNAKYEVGKSYQLTVGVIGSGGGMADGTTLELSLYYRDAASNMVSVATATVTNTPATFPNATSLVDFQVRVPTVKASDAWAGQQVGVQLLSTVRPELAGGYWDVDNVRLSDAIEVPNGSFESPPTAFADPRIDAWSDATKPVWFDESGGATWDQLTGVFANPAADKPDHIDNCDGQQAAFLFAVPQVAMFQDYTSTDWANSTPTHAFNAKYEVGRSYQLTVGLIGGGGGMADGTTLELSLYYRDPASNIVTVAATTVTYAPATFPSTTHFVDFQVRVPTVKASDAWAGKNLGVQILSTVRPDLVGGYWDVDNVRLSEITGPVFALNCTAAGSDVRIAWPSVTGYRYQVQISENLGTWSDYEAPLAGTGDVLFKLVPKASHPQALLRVQATPTP